MQLDLDRILCIIASIALTPIIADRICKYIASPTEPGGSNAATNLRVAFETVLCVLVPEVECAVGAGGAKGAVDGVEGYCVYRVDFCNVALRGVGLAVAFEGEVKAVEIISTCCVVGEDGENIPSILILNILNRAPSLNTPHREPRRVAKAAHNPCLPLQRARNCFVDLCWIAQVHHVNVALRCRYNEQVAVDVHAVHALTRIECTDRLRALQVPKLDRLVPRAGCDVVFAAGLEPAHALDGFGVGFGLLGGDLATCGRGAEVDDVEVAGGVAGSYTCAVLGYVSMLQCL
jgi:hypothetical protein